VEQSQDRQERKVMLSQVDLELEDYYYGQHTTPDPFANIQDYDAKLTARR
jgi:hypothetical protein